LGGFGKMDRRYHKKDGGDYLVLRSDGPTDGSAPATLAKPGYMFRRG
jgi:hypothetical protein